MNATTAGTAAVDLVERVVREFVDDSSANSLGGAFREPALCNPLVGYANGADPLFPALKESAGAGHWTPAEAFALCAGEEVAPDELAVISWVLCQTQATKADNRKQDLYPSERWARARIFGQRGNVELHRIMIEKLAGAGIEALAPALMPQFAVCRDAHSGVTSSWSERHVAYVCGLGTFGLSGGLITAGGKAMRLGSLVAKVRIPPTPRPYDSHTAYCLHYSLGTCGRCAKRCPVGSINAGGRDIRACDRHLQPTTRDFIKAEYGFDGYGCGLCQTGVPCESRIPRQLDPARRPAPAPAPDDAHGR
ncbi:MAG TPA: epoxyqueuosine reductase [Thermoleophilia bacterium]